MTRMQFLGFPHAAYYNRHGWASWPAGEVREVAPEDARRLAEDFPGAFALVEPPAPPVAPTPARVPPPLPPPKRR